MGSSFNRFLKGNWFQVQHFLFSAGLGHNLVQLLSSWTCRRLVITKKAGGEGTARQGNMCIGKHMSRGNRQCNSTLTCTLLRHKDKVRIWKVNRAGWNPIVSSCPLSVVKTVSSWATCVCGIQTKKIWTYSSNNHVSSLTLCRATYSNSTGSHRTFADVQFPFWDKRSGSHFDHF